MSYPEIDLRAHHLSFLMEILTDSHQNSGEVSSKQKNTSHHNTTQLSQNGTRPIIAESPLLKQGQKPGRGRFSHNCPLDFTDNSTEGDDILSHRDFLTCAAAAVSQSEGLDLTENTVSHIKEASYRSPPLTFIDFLN
jgi:hypothetical protein